MKTKSFIILVISVFVLALTATLFVACDNSGKTPLEEKDLNFESGNIQTVTSDCKITAPGEEMYETVDNELPPESFIGTVLEEDTYYMIVQPNADEEEYEISKKIRVEYLSDHIDYLYGIGRKVVITYIPPIVGGSTITTDDIRCDGFEEFELSVQYRDDSYPARFAEIQYAGFLTLVANNRDFDEDASDYNLYYYGLHDVYVTVDGYTLPLKEALSYGKVTLDGIIADCNRQQPAAKTYDDGGSIIYDFGEYKIIKYHTLDGNRDVYIGTSDMTIEAKNATAVYIGAYLWKDWGVRLEAKEVGFDGATVVFKQKGGNVTGELQTGEAFWLERKTGSKWMPVDTLPLIDYAFNMVAYMIDNGGESELETEWQWLYGALGGGQYRIAKEVMDFRGTGDYDKQIYYAYFEKPYLTDYLGTDCISIDGFSYEEDLEKYENSNAEIKTSDFINTTTTLYSYTGDIEVSHISNMDVMIELAMRELGIEDYRSYFINFWVDENYFDDERVMCKISFEDSWYTFSDDGIVTAEGEEEKIVYIDNHGKTHLVVCDSTSVAE